MNYHYIIFTDLDGTLLNHDDYSFEAALPALRKIRDLSHTVVICTSKTRSEVEPIRVQLGFDDPFIVENGGGIFFPERYDGVQIAGGISVPPYRAAVPGVPYGKIRSFIEETRPVCPVRGFADMTVEEVCQRTGLSLKDAVLAREREFTEPFIPEDELLLDLLEVEADRQGLRIVHGGRFYHLIGAGNDKGAAVRLVMEVLSDSFQDQVRSIGLGDSPNDFSMLRAVDIPVLIPHPDGRFSAIELPGLIHAPFPGPAGWNEVMMAQL